MAGVLLELLYLLVVFRCWNVVESSVLVSRPMCSDGSDGKNCRCDELCVLYGDCCSDSPYFVSPEQHHVPSPFICHKSNVYMMSSCPSDWNDPSTRYRCEHPDTTYQDPLFDAPVTSYRTNITYRNMHCALCHDDLDASTNEIWSVYFSCKDPSLNVSKDEMVKYLAYNTETSSWVLNLTTHPDLLIFNNPKPTKLVYNCAVGVMPSDLVKQVWRTCTRSTVDTCPDDWTDDGVRAQCEGNTTYTCPGDTVYRNEYCRICNNNGSFDGEPCYILENRFGSAVISTDFTVLLNWGGLREGATCQQDEQYDPLKQICRSLFVEGEGVTLKNPVMISTNATSNSSLDTCRKIPLEPHEYYIEDNDTLTVFIPAYNMTLQPDEYKIDNQSRLIICWPFDEEYTPEIDNGIRYLTVIGGSLSIVFLVLHLSVFAMTPKLRNLSSMNLASLSVALLVMYCSLFVGSYLSESEVPCVMLAVTVHYSLLASFCWMLTIAYDINRVLRQTSTRLLLTTGKHWQRFGCYSLCSWTCPAAIIAAALVANFSTDPELEYLRPGYGGAECYITNGTALLIFTVGPLFVIMNLNAIFFFWSACIIRLTRSELGNATSKRTNIHLYARLALIMGLTWAVGLIAGYVDVLAVWYVFVILNALQGVFIFLAFTCTRKVWSNVRVQLGLPRDSQTQGAKSVVNTGSAASWT